MIRDQPSSSSLRRTKPPGGEKESDYNVTLADKDNVYPGFAELFPDEWNRNSFEIESPEQVKNWDKLNKWKSENNNLNPDIWPGHKDRELCRPLIQGGKWTCRSIRPKDLGFDKYGNIKSILKKKLQDIGYPQLINLANQRIDYQRTKDAFITPATWEKLVAGGYIHIFPLQTINNQWCRCNVTLCTHNKPIPMKANECLDSPWGLGREIPVPTKYNRKFMPPGPHFMYFDTNGKKFKFYNWFPCLRDLIEHYITVHLSVKPYFGCPYRRCFQTLDWPSDRSQSKC